MTPTQDVAVIEHDGAGLVERPVNLPGLVPQTSAAELVQRLTVIREAMETAMVENVDYGRIPGVNKPSLLKPGAEKLGVLFQFDVQIENEKNWQDDGHLTVVSRATVYHAPSGTRVASGEGICSTLETKYAFRNLDRVCPACGAAAIIKGKAEYGGGWLCWKKHKTVEGCGAKFADDDPVIVSQVVGKAPTENLADTYNTVDKMASKRARIDAILAATGASALFTQDAEDLPKTAAPASSATAEGPPAAERPLIRDVLDGIERLSPTEDSWTLEATLGAASRSFGREINRLDDLTDNELEQILSAMPAEALPFA